MRAGILFVVAFCGGVAFSDAASFPCEKAQSRIEKAICADPEVSGLDEHLGRYYEGAKADLRDGADCLKADQRHWLTTVRNVCADSACLKAAYLARLRELDGLQPGANAVKDVDLPHGPVLVWVIPPAGDAVAAPLDPRARPMEIRGALVDEVSGGDGFTLRVPAGESCLLVMLMFLDDRTAVRLSELAKDTKATYLARGYGVKDQAGRTHYEPGRCIYIYRLP